jgi:two-component system chemotaxis response regulator CheB
MRNALTSMLSSDREIQVIGTARDGIEAIAKVKTLKPDIVTLDVEMPRMDGIEALRHIMAENPVPVVMVSSLTEEGAKVTLEALEIGAVDFIPKNLHDLSVNIMRIREILVDKIKQLARSSRLKLMLKQRGTAARTPAPPPIIEPVVETIPAPEEREEPSRKDRVTTERRVGILAIGTSTGGPKALQEILPQLPEKFPVPILIAQHMPQNFTGPFAERLNHLSSIKVKEGAEGDSLEPGCAYLAPGGHNMRVKRSGAIDYIISISKNNEEYIYCPSVDALFISVNELFPGRALGILLTGMGHDGLDGAREIKRSGGRLFAQDEASCVVYGMPKAVVDEKLADKVLSVERIAGEIINSV